MQLRCGDSGIMTRFLAKKGNWDETYGGSNVL